MLRGVRKLRPLRFHAPNGGNHTQKTPSGGGLLNTTAFGPWSIISIVVAWNVLQPGSAKKHWIPILNRIPDRDPAFRDELHFHEIAARPKDKDEAWAVLSAVVDRHVGRLKELLAHHQASAAAEDADWADRAALDCSTEFERHRRYQSARHRELVRTLEAFRKLRNADFVMGNGEKADGKCRMADDKCRMADDECQVAEGELQVAAKAKGATHGPWCHQLHQVFCGHCWLPELPFSLLFSTSRGRGLRGTVAVPLFAREFVSIR